MGMRKTAIVALIALAGLSLAARQGVSFAQAAPGAMATEAMPSSLSAADKDALTKKLEDAKKHDKIARAGWSQEPLTQAGYDTKIQEIKDLLEKLKKGRDFPPRRRTLQSTEIRRNARSGAGRLRPALELFSIYPQCEICAGSDG